MLPPFAQTLADLIGLDAMHALCKVWGGVPLAVPKTLSPQSALPLEIGTQAAQKLIAHYGGERIEPPKLYGEQVARKHELIRRDREAGMTVVSLALHHDLTARHVRRVLNGAGTNDDRQLDLLG